METDKWSAFREAGKIAYSVNVNGIKLSATENKEMQSQQNI